MQEAVEQAHAVDLPGGLSPEAVTRQVFALYLDQHVQHWLMDEERAPHDAREALSALLDLPRG